MTDTVESPAPSSPESGTPSRFVALLTDQIRNEFAAHQQYVAIAVWFDSRDLPELARHFYRQGVEERNHAMMMVQWMLDRDLKVIIPSVPNVRNDFEGITEPIALALAQEQNVTEQIKRLFATAREEDDFLGEQFMVEEVASMSTLLTIAERAGHDWFDVETFLSREAVGDAGVETDAPTAAGGAL